MQLAKGLLHMHHKREVLVGVGTAGAGSGQRAAGSGQRAAGSGQRDCSWKQQVGKGKGKVRQRAICGS